MSVNGKPRLVFDAGDCERCATKEVTLFYVEVAGRGPNGQTYVKIWLVCVHCFFDMMDVNLGGSLGIP